MPFDKAVTHYFSGIPLKNLMRKKYWTNPKWRTFYRITSLYFSKLSRSCKTKTEVPDYIRLEKQQLNAIRDAGLDLKQKNFSFLKTNIIGTTGKNWTNSSD